MTTRVIFLAEELRIGGAETYYYNLADAAEAGGVDFYSMAVDRGKHDISEGMRNRFFEYGFNPYDRVMKICRAIKEIKPNVLHANSLQLLICAAVAKKCAKSKCKIIYTKHNLTKLEVICERLYYRVVNRLSDAIVVVCASDRCDFETAGVESEKIVQINNGVDINEFKYAPHVPNHKKPVLGILARLSQEKNHELYLRVCVELKALGSLVEGKIGGDGVEFDAIADKILELGLKDDVEMCGRVNAVSFLNEIDYLLIVSNREVMPMSILEAMATGRLVIARDVGGIADAVKQGCGLLIDCDAPADDYALAISKMSDEEYTRMTANARDRVVSEFNLDKSLKMHYELYNALSNT